MVLPGEVREKAVDSATLAEFTVPGTSQQVAKERLALGSTAGGKVSAAFEAKGHGEASHVQGARVGQA